VSFGCEVHKTVRSSRRPQARIGVDVGLRHLAVLSDGRRIPNPAPLQAALRELRLLNRQLARRTGPITLDGTRREPSNGWLEAKRRLGRAHAKVADIRRDALHHLTSTLAATYQTVVMERLNVAGMLKNRRLARRLADAGLGELRRQLGYKTAWAGGTLVLADTFFPSSKTCSGCGHVKPSCPCRSGPTGASAAGWCSTATRTQPAASPPSSRRVGRWRWSPGVARRPETLGERT
jgi:IS605 OrfB family transposase